MIEEVADGFRGVCWGVFFEGVLPAFESDALGCGDLPFNGDLDKALCEDRRAEPFNCLGGVLGAAFWTCLGLAGERAGEDTPFVGAVRERVESTRTRFNSSLDSFFFTTTPTVGTDGDVCARPTTGDAEPDPGRRCGIELDNRLLKLSGVGVENGRKGLENWVQNKSTLVEMGGQVATVFTKLNSKL